jgi:hypothetical protein
MAFGLMIVSSLEMRLVLLAVLISGHQLQPEISKIHFQFLNHFANIHAQFINHFAEIQVVSQLFRALWFNARVLVLLARFNPLKTKRICFI